MNSAGFSTLVLACIGITLTAIFTVKAMRYIGKRSPGRQMIENGIVLNSTGIQFQGMLLLTTKVVPYQEIASVELLSPLKGWLAPAFMRYGISVRSIRTKFFSPLLVVKLKNPKPFEYVMFTPSNASTIYEQIKSKLS